MNVLIIGLGSIGKRHLNNILEHREEWGIEKVLAFDPDVETWQGSDGIRGDYEFIYDPVHMLSTPFDAAIICTPPEHHYEYSLLTRQAHILVEKPLTYNLPWKKERTGRLVLAAMNLRFHKGVSWARNQVKAGVIGTPLLGKAWYGYNGIIKNRPDSPDAKLGPLVSAIHDLDALLWVLGGITDSPHNHRLKANIKHLAPFKKWGVVYGEVGNSRTGFRLEADFLLLTIPRPLLPISQQHFHLPNHIHHLLKFMRLYGEVMVWPFPSLIICKMLFNCHGP